MSRLHGIIPPTTTPFTADGEVDYAAARRQVRWVMDQGVHGIATGGGTGEGHTLDPDEFRRLIAERPRLRQAESQSSPALLSIARGTLSAARQGGGRAGRGGAAGHSGALPVPAG